MKTVSMKKQITNSDGIVGILILIVVVVVVAGLFLTGKLGGLKNLVQNPQNGQQANQSLATDPNIVEVKGQLVEGFPDFPVYPEAKLVQSVQLKKSGSVGGYRARWELAGESVPKVMEWYVKELRSKGWVVQPPDDPKAYGEQIATITKDNQAAYLRVELHEQGIIEIEVDIPPR